MISLFRRTISGFTVIEMVVVIAIIGITSSIVITSLMAGRAVRLTEQAVHDVASALRQAQNFALTGKANTGEESCYFGLRFNSSSQYVLVQYYRSSGNCNSYHTLTTTNLSGGVTFTGIGSYPTTLAFSLPRAEVYSATSGAFSGLATAQLIGLTKSSRTQYLCLYPGGRIEERGTTGTCP